MTGVDLGAIKERVDFLGVLPVFMDGKWRLLASVDARPLLEAGSASLNRPLGNDLAVEKVPYFDSVYRRWRLGTRRQAEELIDRGQASLTPLPDTSDFAAHAKQKRESLQRG